MFHPKGPTFFELAQQALSSTEHGYDLLAPKFEYTPFRTPDDLVMPTAAQLAQPGELECALDVCCGTGAGVRMLRPLCTGHVTGVDTSQGMLEEAERRLADAPGTAEIRLLREDALNLPFEDEFDVATCFGALGHILESDQDPFVDSIRRALKPGGRFAFVTGDMPTPLNPMWWLGRGFNFAMHVRNALLSPPFVMFYLTFTTEESRELLTRHGFGVTVRTGVYDKYPTAKLIIATRR